MVERGWGRVDGGDIAACVTMGCCAECLLDGRASPA